MDLLTPENFWMQDVKKILRIPNAFVLEMGFNRPNLTYEVVAKVPKDSLKQLGKIIIDRFKNQSGIVYCLSKNECMDVRDYLVQKCHIKTVCYHAGLGSRERMNVQQRWQRGEAKVVCATIAFGMGIDKPDVVCLLRTPVPNSRLKAIFELLRPQQRSILRGLSKPFSFVCSDLLSTTPCPRLWRGTTKNPGALGEMGFLQPAWFYS